jgi:hypothetical protein
VNIMKSFKTIFSRGEPLYKYRTKIFDGKKYHAYSVSDTKQRANADGTYNYLWLPQGVNRASLKR